MILGYVDSDDRIYDLNFATLRLRVRIEAGEKGEPSRIAFSQIAGGGAASYRILGEADATAEVSMDHDGQRVPLLRPVDGHAYRHEKGVIFFAAPTTRDPEDPGYFLVKLRAMPSAVKFFFEDQEGRELISIPQDEILRTAEEGGGITVFVSAANVALPKEKIAYAVQFKPASRAASLLVDLVSKPARGRNP
ncbi:MAG TPA: hypothetical protein VEO20_10270 [Thermoplasmata archaeon]|nr:hypothetical protein [Thermoplasmata archaeon]